MIPANMFRLAQAIQTNLDIAIAGVQELMQAQGERIEAGENIDPGDSFALGELMSVGGFLTAAAEPLQSFLERPKSIAEALLREGKPAND